MKTPELISGTLYNAQAKVFVKWEKKGYVPAFKDSKGNLIIKRERRDDRGKLIGRFEYKTISVNGHTENLYN